MSINVFAVSEVIIGAKVQKILLHSSLFGTCMVLLDKRLSSYGLNCPSRWLTLSCTGVFDSKETAFKKLDLFQMAFALDRTIDTSVDDTKKHNGYCFSSSVNIN